MSERIKIALPIVVEGRYDKSTLSGFLDATIITTGGFSVQMRGTDISGFS